MRRQRHFAAGIAAAILGSMAAAHAQTEKVLYSFDGDDGKNPDARMLRDKSGTLYGTTTVGGAHHHGTVFTLTPTNGKSWKETVLYSFRGGDDGSDSWGGLVRDKMGVLYGITLGGGGQCDCGTVFALSQTAGTWSESVIHAFSGTDGDYPVGELTLDSSGNLFGVTLYGGANDSGAAFELSPSHGSWKETVLYSFCNDGGFGGCTDGSMPKGVHMDPSSGALFGTTQLGGNNGDGTIFELSNAHGTWSQSVLYNYESFDAPVGRLIEDTSGALYGATYEGGRARCGSVFRFYRKRGVWTYQDLYSFAGGSDACFPDAGLHMDSSGALYGTTSRGGTANGGTVFKVSSTLAGSWGETVLHSFTGRPDGYFPLAAILGGDVTGGKLYGVTDSGGANNKGAVFEIVP